MRSEKGAMCTPVLQFTNCRILRGRKLLRWSMGPVGSQPCAARVSAGPGVEGGVWGPPSEPPLLSVRREDLWVRGGRILDPERLFFEERLVADEQRDCGGCILAPGFIDVQINGMSRGLGVEIQGRSAEHCVIPCFCGRRWIWC